MLVTLLESNSVKSTDSKLIALENAKLQLVILDIPTIFTLFNAVFDQKTLLSLLVLFAWTVFPRNDLTSPYTLIVIVDPSSNADVCILTSLSYDVVDEEIAPSLYV